MLTWRLCRRPHADLSGEGARLFGGRWNSPGRAVVYLAEHTALAALEVRVHLDLPFELLPSDYVLVGVTIPDRLLSNAEPSADTVQAGNAWLSAKRSAALRVPSVLVRHAWNVLLNPIHEDAALARVSIVESFRFDPRLWQPMGRENPR